MCSKRYSLEQAQTEAAQIQELVGKKGSKEDYVEAEKLVEEEKWQDPEYLRERLERGLVTIVLSEADKGPMIALKTDDSERYRFFNQVASVHTQRYNGFHLIGFDQDKGYTAWKLRRRPRESSVLPKVVKRIEEIMERAEDE